jgi:hypothetical protein
MRYILYVSFLVYRSIYHSTIEVSFQWILSNYNSSFNQWNDIFFNSFVSSSNFNLLHFFNMILYGQTEWSAKVSYSSVFVSGSITCDCLVSTERMNLFSFFACDNSFILWVCALKSKVRLIKISKRYYIMI